MTVDLAKTVFYFFPPQLLATIYLGNHYLAFCHHIMQRDLSLLGLTPALSQELSQGSILMCLFSFRNHLSIISQMTDRWFLGRWLLSQSKVQPPAPLSGPRIARCQAWHFEDSRQKCHCRCFYQVSGPTPTRVVWWYIFIPDLSLLHKPIHEGSCMPSIPLSRGPNNKRSWVGAVVGRVSPVSISYDPECTLLRNTFHCIHVKHICLLELLVGSSRL